MYLEQIEQLVVLQKVDDEIILLEQDLEASPRELAELVEKANAADEQKVQMEDKLNLLKTQQKRLESEIEENTLKIKKSKNKLMMVGNTKEYHAMLREMDNMEKITRSREEDLAAMGEEYSRQVESMSTMEADTSALNTEVKEKKTTLDARMAEAQTRLDKLNKRRQKACKVVPPPILGRYEFIRSRISNPVIVPVEGGVCGGCHISIPPQVYNDLQKGEQIISCPNCQRLTYWSEHFQTEEDIQKAKEKAELEEAKKPAKKAAKKPAKKAAKKTTKATAKTASKATAKAAPKTAAKKTTKKTTKKAAKTVEAAEPEETKE